MDEEDLLTREQIRALASSFPVESAKALLSAARFPAWPIPLSGCKNFDEFWAEIASKIAGGVMEDGRRKFPAAARDVYRWSETIPGPPPTALRGPRTRLLTTWQPPDGPSADPAGPWHAHLPPGPAPAQLTTAIARLLSPGPASS